MSQKSEVKGIKACVFDAYGTLFDVHSAVGHYREAFRGKADAVSAVWRTKQLEYTWLRSLMGCHADFWQVTGEALDFAMDMHDLRDKELYKSLMEAYLGLSCYAEVVSTLNLLREKGHRIAILSNGTPKMLESAVANSGLENLVDHIYSVEEVGIFKPDPRVYRLPLDDMGLRPEEILFHSSNAWDASGAAYFGMRVAWINRFGQSMERLPGKPDLELQSLEEVPGYIT